MRRAWTALVSTAATVALLAACSPDEEDTSGAPATSAPPSSQTAAADPSADPTTPTPMPTPAGSVVPRFPDDTEGQFQQDPGVPGVPAGAFAGVRVAEHRGFDRIVLQTAGRSIPGWAVSWVDAPRADGSGEEVALGGDAFLDIYVHGTSMPAPRPAPRPVEPADGGDVAEVRVVGWFEGTTQVLAGVDGDRAPFRAFTLTDPPRLVVDIRDDRDD